MDYLACIIIGFFIGVIFSRLMVIIEQQRKLDAIDKVVSEKLEELKSKIIPSRIEVTDTGLFLLYNSETGEFLGQGQGIDELEIAVKARYPGKLFNVPQEQLDKFVNTKECNESV